MVAVAAGAGAAAGAKAGEAGWREWVWCGGRGAWGERGLYW